MVPLKLEPGQAHSPDTPRVSDLQDAVFLHGHNRLITSIQLLVNFNIPLTRSHSCFVGSEAGQIISAVTLGGLVLLVAAGELGPGHK